MTSDSTELPPPMLDLSADSSFFLDFDGTLVELIDDPAAVSVDHGLRSLIHKLQQRFDGRVALLTGRAAEPTRKLFLPIDVVVAGSHGLELPGTSVRPRAASLNERLAGLRQLAIEHPGVIVEEKPLGVALHFRQAPHAEETCRKAAENVARATGLEIQPGKMVFELKPSGGNKGEAVRELMKDARFAGSTPIVVGDDLTDEPAFEAAKALGGIGILVGERGGTRATHKLPTVSDTLVWLEALAEAA